MQNPFEEIKNRLSVVDVISKYLPIKSSGANYKVNCPFHGEKTPSLIISPSKNIWHCFGCGEGGDMFRFVMLYENVDKKIALESLASMAGVELSSYKPEKQNLKKSNTGNVLTETEIGFKYLEWSKNLYHKVLLRILENRNHPVTKYCLKRGLDKEVIEKFKIGYAPNNNFLISLASKYNLNKDILKKTSLLKSSEFDSALRDKFSDRLMIPIYNTSRKIVGYTGRVLDYDTNPNRPKYLNSAQSDWFDKSQIWYGWHLHADAIRKQKKAIIVEGNMDVIKASQYRINYSLASQGTSFTIDQLKKLKRLTSTILLAFDNDQAGMIASKKLFKEASVLGFEIQKVLIDSQFKDLDEMLSSYNQQEAIDLKSVSYLDYIINTDYSVLFNPQSIDKQKQVILDFLEHLAFVDTITSEQYIQKISQISGISTRALNLELDRISKNQLKRVENTASNLQQLSNSATKEIIKSSNDIQNVMMVNWQNLVSLSYDNQDNNELLVDMFGLLKSLLSRLGEFDSFDSWYKESQEEISLIKESLDRNNEDNNHKKSLFQVFLNYFNTNFSRFMLDESLKNKYQITAQILREKIKSKE